MESYSTHGHQFLKTCKILQLLLLIHNKLHYIFYTYMKYWNDPKLFYFVLYFISRTYSMAIIVIDNP